MRHIICAATLTLCSCGPEGSFTQETNPLPASTVSASEQSADAVGELPESPSTASGAQEASTSTIETDGPIKATAALNSAEIPTNISRDEPQIPASFAPATQTTPTSEPATATNSTTLPAAPSTNPIVPAPPPAPAPAPLACNSSTTILGASQSTELVWSGTGPAAFTLRTLSLNPPVNIGSIKVSTDGSLHVTYTAPISALVAFDVQVVARSSSGSEAACDVKIKADGDLGVADDGSTQGIVGSVYEIPYASRINSAKITSSWFSGTPLASILMPRLDVPNTPYENGFPGYPNLTSWYAIRFMSRLVVPVTGSYTFQTKSDDGSNLYIDGRLVVANDRVQAITTAISTSIQLTAGVHDLQMDYFQGPPIYIAMMMLWRIPGANSFTVIPSTNLLRPL